MEFICYTKCIYFGDLGFSTQSYLFPPVNVHVKRVSYCICRQCLAGCLSTSKNLDGVASTPDVLGALKSLHCRAGNTRCLGYLQLPPNNSIHKTWAEKSTIIHSFPEVKGHLTMNVERINLVAHKRNRSVANLFFLSKSILGKCAKECYSGTIRTQSIAF